MEDTTLPPSPLAVAPRARAIAFYLPQYHPIAENDEWWGRGFTEWTNTAKAKPLFRGHYQPHIPADLGFYDLRVPETREQQASMARAYGIEAFCYYHYWFAGRRLLERPFNEVLDSGHPDFPFCLCWANESWTGVWHGAPRRMLIEQTYPGDADHRAHFRYLARAFADPRYIRVGGRPLFLLYSPDRLPDRDRVLDLFRTWSVQEGIGDLYIAGISWEFGHRARLSGLDGEVVQSLPARQEWYPYSRPIRKVSRYVSWRLGQPTIVDYATATAAMLPDSLPSRHAYPTAIPNWDNSPRSGRRGLCLQGSTPALYRNHLERAVSIVEDRAMDERLVFIKSWNEWAEGNHLEPDLRFGHQYLEATRSVLFGDE